MSLAVYNGRKDVSGGGMVSYVQYDLLGNTLYHNQELKITIGSINGEVNKIFIQDFFIAEYEMSYYSSVLSGMGEISMENCAECLNGIVEGTEVCDHGTS